MDKKPVFSPEVLYKCKDGLFLRPQVEEKLWPKVQETSKKVINWQYSNQFLVHLHISLAIFCRLKHKKHSVFQKPTLPMGVATGPQPIDVDFDPSLPSSAERKRIRPARFQKHVVTDPAVIFGESMSVPTSWKTRFFFVPLF